MNQKEKIRICNEIIEHETHLRKTLGMQLQTNYIKKKISEIDVMVQALEMLKRKLVKGEAK